MLRKEVKTPMIISLILYGVAYLTMIIITLGQKQFVRIVRAYDFNVDKPVIPYQIFTQLISILGVFICFMIMKTYKGNSRRTVAGVMIAAQLALGMLLGLSAYIAAVVYSRAGQEYYAMLSGVNQVISLASSPIGSVAWVFNIVALGRYGITEPEIAENNMFQQQI